MLGRSIFAVCAKQLNGNIARQQVSEDFFLVWLIFNRCRNADGIAFTGGNSDGHQLNLRWRLRKDVFELAEEQMRDIKFARFKTCGQIFAPCLYISVSELAQIAWFNAVDDIATESPAELIAAFLSDGIEFNGLAFGLQCFCLTAGKTDDIGVECASKALVAGGDNEQMHVAVA